MIADIPVQSFGGVDLSLIQAVGLIGFAVIVVLLVLWITAKQNVKERAQNAESLRLLRDERAAVELAKETVIRETQDKLERMYEERLADERKDSERLEKRIEDFELQITEIRKQNKERENQHAEAIAAMQRYQRQKDKQHSDLVRGKDKEIQELTDTKLALQNRVDTLETQMRSSEDNQVMMQQEINEKIGFQTALTKELESRLRDRGADTGELRSIRESVTDKIKNKKAQSDADETTHNSPGRG